MNAPNKGMKRIGRWIYYVSLILFLIAVADWNSYAQKKEFPERAIKFIVHVSPGSSGDLWARAWSDDFSKLLKVPVVINNQGGASGVNALIDAKSAAPDGYTITVMAHSHVVGSAISPDFPVDLFKDFVPIGGFGSFPLIIAVEASLPFFTWDDVDNYAKKNPGKLKFGSPGVTMPSHFSFELLKKEAKLDIVTVPFKSSTEATTALLGKHVDLAGIPTTTVRGFLKAGKVRIILTTQRLKDYPNVPLFAEKGLKEAGITTWMGIAARSEIPKEVYKKLADTFEKVAKDPNVMEKLETLGYKPEYANGTDFLALLKRDYDKVRKIAKEAGMISQ